jgi:multiple sugar transport system ATP-binding protein
MTMGDRVCVLKDGILQQVDTPLGLYDTPANIFVAGFIGSPAMNLIEADHSNGHALIGDHEVPVDASLAARASGRLVVGVRPEAWQLARHEEPALSVTVDLMEELGADAYLYGSTTHADSSIPLTARIDGVRDVEKGATVRLTVDPAHLHLFDAASGERLHA